MVTTTPPAPALPATVEAFLTDWQPRQRRTLGMLNALIVRVSSLANAHPEWAGYDLLTNLLAAMHLVVENDRLTGGRTRAEIVADLASLPAAEHPEDEPETHLSIAEALLDVLTNGRERERRFRDHHLAYGPDGVTTADTSFRLARVGGPEDTLDPTLRAEVELINLFDNLYQFDPSDRAMAERYRSERMLKREEYDEVLTSVARRASSVHAERAELRAVERRLRRNVRGIDYVTEVIPRLDAALASITEQVEAEERFAEAVDEHLHRDAPDLPRLRLIWERCGELVNDLMGLQASARNLRHAFENEQDRQLFTYRRSTLSPQPDLFEPALELSPDELLDRLADLLQGWLSAHRPRVWHLGLLAERTAPIERASAPKAKVDPFDLGTRRAEPPEPPALIAIRHLVRSLSRPTRLSELLDVAQASNATDMSLPWALTVAVSSLYGTTPHKGRAAEHHPLGAPVAVVATGRELHADLPIAGNDLVVVPLNPPEET